MTTQLLNRLKLIGIYCHVVESGSMREAAKKLGISPPAVSQYINQLETELSVTLLYRSTRRINMSEAGEKYYQQGKKMLNAAEQAEDVINRSKQSISGQLRVAIPVGLAARPLARALKPMLQEHQDLTLSVFASDKSIDLIQERIDLVVDCGEPEDSNYIYHFLGKNRKFVCASPSYLKQEGSPVTPADLESHIWLSLGETEAKGVLSNVELKHAKSDTYRFTPNPRLTFNNLNALISHVQEGHGIALLPELEIKHLLDSGDLVTLLPDWQIENHNIFALTRDKKSPYKVKAALEALKAHFGSTAT